MNEIKTYPAWLLNQGNGAIPDLTHGVDFPDKPSGDTGGKREETRKLDDIIGAAATRRLPEVVIFEHINFGGNSARTNLNWLYVGGWWNDRISSIIVVSGTWRFYEHAHYAGRYWDLGPNYYPWVQNVGIPNDIISSFQVIAY